MWEWSVAWRTASKLKRVATRLGALYNGGAGGTSGERAPRVEAAKEVGT